MTLSFALKRRDPAQQRFERVVEITLDNSYPSPGGWAISAKDLGFGSSAILDHLALGSTLTTNGYFLVWDAANGKLKAYQCAGAGAAATELANNASVLSGIKVPVRAVASGQQT
jgi:hypothetical protein